MALLEASGIGKNFGDTKVLKDISLTLEQGEALNVFVQRAAPHDGRRDAAERVVHQPASSR